MRVTRRRFEELTEQAVDDIPPAFRTLFSSLVILVRNLPGPESKQWRGSRRLLGLYTGLYRTDMAAVPGAYLPARIYLYQRNLEALCDSEDELRRRIRITLRHEVAHHFGFSDEDIRRRWPEGA